MPGIQWIGFGTQEAGYVTGGTTLVPVSKTTKDGVDLQLNSTFVDAYGGMDVLPADSRQERGELTLGMTFLRADLLTFRFALGLPDGAHTGDLSAATPTQEVLSVDAGDIGSTRRHLYALGPGPASTRKIEIPNAQWQGVNGLGMKGNAHTHPQATFRALTPTAGAALTITDAV